MISSPATVMSLDKDKLSHVDAVRAAAKGDGPGETATQELRHLFGSIPVLPPSFLRIDVDDGPNSQTQGELLLLGSSKYAEVFQGSVRLSCAADAAEQPCAIKRLRAKKGMRAQRLLQEALTLIRCQDPKQAPLLLAVVLGGGHYYLVRLRGADSWSGLQDAHLFVFKRFGGTLKQYIQDHDPSPAERLGLLLRCARLLRSVHDQRVCHNDVKADNFLISEDGKDMVLCDFGFAVHPDLMYLPDRVRGTPKFYAPELRGVLKKAEKVEQGTDVRRSTRGATLPDNRLPADAFSFGAMIQECVSKELEPYPTLSRDEWIDVATHRPKELAAHTAKLPDEYNQTKELLTSCCNLRADTRPTIQSICSQLEHMLQLFKKPSKSKAMAAQRQRRRVVVQQQELDSEEETGQEGHAQSASAAHSHSQQRGGGGAALAPLGSGSAPSFAAASRAADLPQWGADAHRDGDEETKAEPDDIPQAASASDPAGSSAAAPSAGAAEVEVEPDFIALPYECKHCSGSFPIWAHLNSHLKSHRSPAEGQRHQCSHCHGAFHSQKTMMRHQRACKGERPSNSTTSDRSDGDTQAATASAPAAIAVAVAADAVAPAAAAAAAHVAPAFALSDPSPQSPAAAPPVAPSSESTAPSAKPAAPQSSKGGLAALQITFEQAEAVAKWKTEIHAHAERTAIALLTMCAVTPVNGSEGRGQQHWAEHFLAKLPSHVQTLFAARVHSTGLAGDSSASGAADSCSQSAARTHSGRSITSSSCSTASMAPGSRPPFSPASLPGLAPSDSRSAGSSGPTPSPPGLLPMHNNVPAGAAAVNATRKRQREEPAAAPGPAMPFAASHHGQVHGPGWELPSAAHFGSGGGGDRKRPRLHQPRKHSQQPRSSAAAAAAAAAALAASSAPPGGADDSSTIDISLSL